MRWLKLYYEVRETVDDVAARGGRCRVKCVDGFKMSVIAYEGTYCSPRPGWGEVPADYEGPFVAVEVGFPSARPEPWDMWESFCEDTDAPTDTVYSYVSVQAVNDLIALHGGYA